MTFPNLFSNCLLHTRRPVTPMVHLNSPKSSRISSRQYVTNAETKYFAASPVPYPRNRRQMFTSSQQYKGKKDDKDKKPDDKSQKPPWPPYGPEPMCCLPSSDQNCIPLPPRNPNPFYNSPQPYIKVPAPPWRDPPREPPCPECPLSPSPPLPPVSLMPDSSPSALPKPPRKKEFTGIDPKFKFDVLQGLDHVLYEDDEYYESLNEYYKPDYKVLDYYSFTPTSYYDMAVELTKFYAFSK